MGSAAATPEELETLLEDALLLGDPAAVADLFVDGAVLTSCGSPEARGRVAIAAAAQEMCLRRDHYLPELSRVVQARDTALIVCRSAMNVATRGRDGTWRYAIAVLSTPTNGNPKGDRT